MEDGLSRRQTIRFSPEESTLALFDYKGKSGAFSPTSIGLVIDESKQGSGVVMLKKNAPDMGQQFQIKVGELPVVKASCAWAKDLDDYVVRVGIQFHD